MAPEQIRSAIELGRDIEAGRIDLCELDQISLACQVKNPDKYGDGTSGFGSKRKRPAKERDAGDEKVPAKNPKRQSTLSFSGNKSPPDSTSSRTTEAGDISFDPDFAKTLEVIRKHPSLTPYRKRLYSIPLSVPHGRYTNYVAISDYLSSSPRAVGSGMRNNLFAPDVLCHRCLAADGSIGGFNGDCGV